MPEKKGSGRTFLLMQGLDQNSFTITLASVLPQCHTFGLLFPGQIHESGRPSSARICERSQMRLKAS
jgi:hypothetical protein